MKFYQRLGFKKVEGVDWEKLGEDPEEFVEGQVYMENFFYGKRGGKAR